jgi:O-antigen ligase
MSFAVTTAQSASGSLEAQEVKKQPGGLAFSAARLLLGAALLTAPLAFGAVQEWAWAALSVLAIFGLWLWAIGSVQQGVLRIVWCSLYLPALLFLGLGAIQFFLRLSPDPIALRESLLKLVTDLLFFFLVGQLLASSSDQTWRRLGLAVSVFAFSISLFAILQFFSSHGLIYWQVKPRWGGTIFGPYVNHSHYAGLMEMLIPLSAGYVLFRPKSHPTRALLSFAVVVQIASVFLSGSRGGLIALFVEFLILAVVLLRRAVASTRRKLVLPIALGMAASVLLFLWMDPGDVSKRLETVVRLGDSPEAALGYRKNVPLDSLRIFLDHPWMGAGLGSFRVVYPRYQSFPSDLLWDHAHNDYAEALAETGLAGALLILWALGSFFRLAFRNLPERIIHGRDSIRLGAAVGCCGLLVHSLSDFNLHIPANAAWFAVCAACATVGLPAGLSSPKAREQESRFVSVVSGMRFSQ